MALCEWYIGANLHGVMTHETEILINSAVKTPDLAVIVLLKKTTMSALLSVIKQTRAVKESMYDFQIRKKKKRNFIRVTVLNVKQ